VVLRRSFDSGIPSGTRRPQRGVTRYKPFMNVVSPVPESLRLKVAELEQNVQLLK
jgi:hypothetical protein